MQKASMCKVLMANNMYSNRLPLLTVGLVFYNTEKTMANAIKSVLMQSFTDFEMILIDDGLA